MILSTKWKESCSVLEQTEKYVLGMRSERIGERDQLKLWNKKVNKIILQVKKVLSSKTLNFILLREDVWIKSSK